MKIFIQIIKSQFTLFFFVFVCLVNSTYGQTTGDYRTKASGDWITLATWERWNGTAWVEPTVGEGYPCQSASPTRVDILNSHNVTCGIGVSGTNRPKRIGVAAVANDTSLSFTSSNYFDVNGNIALTATGTGNAFLNVNAASVAATGVVNLGDTPSAATDCEVVITTGNFYVFGGNLAMVGAVDENAIRLGSGTLTCAGNITGLGGGTIDAGTGRVIYNGAAQTVGAYTFNNLTLSGSGTKTVNAATVINGNVTISGTAVASLNAGTTYNVNSLILGTNGQTQGTWGSTTSAATNTNNTYFAATTGMLNVAFSTPDVTPTIGSYVYTGSSQGPNTSTNTGTGTSYTFSYQNSGGTSYGPSATPPTNVGNYTVTTTVAANGVYVARSSTATPFSISQRALTITANNGSKIYGTTYTTGAGSTAFTTSGLQAGQTIGSITIASTGAISSALLGTYPIVPSAAIGGTFAASNYVITYSNGTLTVNPESGDYRSKASANWNLLTTWERWNGSAWVEPTPGEGYPSQNAAPSSIYILDTHNVTCNVTITGTNKPARIEMSAGSGTSSLTISGSNALEVSGGVRIMPSTAVGVSRSLNVGAGFLNCGNIRIDDTGNDSVDSEIILSTGGIYTFGNISMLGSSARNAFRFTDSGSLRCGDAFTGGTLIPSTGRVEFFKAGNQTIGAYTFNNLTLSGSGIKTFNTATSIAGNLTITGVKALLPTGSNIPVNSLILGNNGKLLGTWGSTTSSPTPTYNDDTYFETNPTAGILTITKSTSDVTVTVGTYTYTGLANGPNVATNAPGTGTNYTFSYVGVSPTVYGPSSTRPTIVGTYSVTATVAADGDFVVRSSVATPFSIAKAPLTITANTTTIVYKDSYTFGVGSTDFTSSGLQNGETIGSVTMGSDTDGRIGTYTNYPSAATGGTFTASNYTITYNNGSLTINPKIGDYRTKASGDWSVLATWERWSGSAWVEPTTGEGYPGRFSSPGTVYIENTHNINGNRTLTGANKLGELIFSEGSGNSSLSIIGSNSIVVNFQVVVRSGGNRNINVGAGFLSVGGFNFSDTGSDSIDSKLTVSTGAIYVFDSLIMNGSAARNTVEFTGSGGELFFTTSGTMTGGTLIPASGTVYYNGAVSQNVGSYDYTNLVLRGDGIKTVPADVTISSNLTIDGSATASLNSGTTYYVGTLTLGCRDSEDGTWGSTTSAAVYTNDTYFEPTTGLIDVTTDTSLKTPDTTGVQPTCATPTVTITITVQYATDTYSFDNGATFQASNVKSGLSAGTYNIIIKNSKGCTSPTKTVTLVSATRTWNGSVNAEWNNAANWTPNGVPTADNCIEIPNNVTVTGTNYTGLGYNLTVLNGGNLTVNPTNSLKITDFVNVNTGGLLSFEDKSSLVQINDVANTGAITYNRNSTTVRETDYTYWSSPVAGQNLLAVSPTTKLDKFYSFDAAANDWVQLDPSSTTMTIGKGYIIRGVPLPAFPPPGFPKSSFIGVPNNGDKTIEVVGGETSNLIGNPYPSAIDADEFLTANNTKIDGTIYLWTHSTEIQDRNLITGVDEFGTPKAGSGELAYTSDDYATYNGTGGAAATSGGATPDGTIAAGQSFFTTSTPSGGTVTFTNSMRVDGSGNVLNNSSFYKIKNQKLITAIEKHRIWLNLTNKQGAFKQTLLGYITDATNSWDNLYDGESYDGNEFVDFYSINQDKNLVIQGRALPFDETDEVPLGYRTTINGEFTLSIDQVDGLLTNQAVFVEDKLTNMIANLKTANYTFSTTVGTFNDRFVLRFKDKTLGKNDLTIQSNLVLISIKNKQIKINSFVETIDKVTIYDLAGRQIYQKDKVSSNELIVSNFVSSHQTLIVKTTLENGKTVSNKIIY